MKKKIFAILCCLAVALVSACAETTVTDFAAALNTAEGVTLSEQVTTIKDGETTVYECTVTVTTGETATKVERVTRTLNPLGSAEMFAEERETEYYAAGLRYFEENGVWKTEAGSFGESSRYSVTVNDFADAAFEGRTLRAKIPAGSVGKFGGGADTLDMRVRIDLDAEIDRVSALLIEYGTPEGRAVTVETAYSYGPQSVTLPTAG